MSETTTGNLPPQPPQDGPLTIMGVVGIHRLEYTYPNGEVAGEPTDIRSSDTFKTTVKSLSRISRTLGPGTYTHEQLSAVSNATTVAIGNLVVRMETSAPEGIMSQTEQGTVQLGSFLVDAREATESERAAYKERERVRQAAAAEQRKLELLAAEDGKVHIGMHDHALITINNGTYRMGLEHWDEILLTRALMHMDPTDASITVRDFARTVWRAMPLAERALFVKKEELIYNDATQSCKNLETRLDLLFETVTSQLGVTGRCSTPGFFTIKANRVGVQLVADPNAATASHVKVLAPPRRAIEDPTEQTTPQEMLEAAEVLSRIRRKSGREMTDEACIEMLDVLTSNRGKIILARALEATNSSESLQDILELGHRLLRRRLGDGTYWDTYRQRMIGGNRSGGHVTQVTGGSRYLSRTKWIIGTPQDPQGAVEAN